MEAITLYTEKLTGFDEEQFFQFCIQNQELKFERDKNKNIIIMAPTGALTGNYNFKILRVLGNWIQVQDLHYLIKPCVLQMLLGLPKSVGKKYL